MGSKYRVIPYLVEIFSELSFESALDAFSGSGVVSYALKAMGKAVTANDFLNFPATIARAVIENSEVVLTDDDVARILSPAPKASDFIRRTFDGLYFPPEDLFFLDSAWAHVDELPGYKRDLALSEVFRRFRHSTIVLSYSSNSIPGEQEIYELLRSQKQHVEFFAVPHRYSFGTHATARRREVQEYIFVAQ